MRWGPGRDLQGVPGTAREGGWVTVSVWRGRREAHPLFARGRGRGHDLLVLGRRLIVGDAGLLAAAALRVARHLLVGRRGGGTGQSGEDGDRMLGRAEGAVRLGGAPGSAIPSPPVAGFPLVLGLPLALRALPVHHDPGEAAARPAGQVTVLGIGGTVAGGLLQLAPPDDEEGDDYEKSHSQEGHHHVHSVRALRAVPGVLDRVHRAAVAFPKLHLQWEQRNNITCCR